MKRPLVLLAVGGVVAGCGSAEPTPARTEPANTAAVEQGPLSALVSLNGTLTYRARPDGAPYSVINHARGIYTKLPEEGERVDCGDVLYRVDADPVRLRCGAVPAYRALRRGDAVYLPRSGRIAKVSGELGAYARPGAEIVQATSNTLEVQVALEATQQGDVKAGDRARVTLPGNRSVKGRVDRIATVARTADKDAGVGSATIAASIRLDEPKQARGLDKAPVQVDITTEGVQNALSVPVTALVGKAGGGYAVEVVRDGGRRELVSVQLGLFDTAAGRVAVEGEVAAGDRVVVPSP